MSDETEQTAESEPTITIPERKHKLHLAAYEAYKLVYFIEKAQHSLQLKTQEIAELEGNS